MKFKILGCGTSVGVPVPGCPCEICHSEDPRNRRLRASALLSIESSDNSRGSNIVIDTSPDLRQQSLRYGITHIESVLYTHAHADHILGMDDLRSFNFTSGVAIDCYGTSFTKSEISKVFHYIFSPQESYEGGLLTQIKWHNIEPGKPFNSCGVEFIPFALKHGSTDVLGFRIGDLAYATDCNFIPDSSLNILKGIKTLILDGLRHEPHRTHFTIGEAVEMAKKIGAQKTYLTHMNHAVDYSTLREELPNGIEPAYDGLEIEL